LRGSAAVALGPSDYAIGRDVSKRLNKVPAKVRVIATRRPMYACPTCEKTGADEVAGIVQGASARTAGRGRAANRGLRRRCRSGRSTPTTDHVLIPDNVYGPVRQFCRDWLMPRGIAHTIYDPMIGVAIGDVTTERTKLVSIETPGSVTFEVQDAPAIIRAAKAEAPTGCSIPRSPVPRTCELEARFRGCIGRLQPGAQARHRCAAGRSKALRLFAIGASCGTRSLIAPMSVTEERTTAAPWPRDGAILRISIGLEDPDNLWNGPDGLFRSIDG
jgi:cystathionine beta-lyase/cystathionine gamma-synthase